MNSRELKEQLVDAVMDRLLYALASHDQIIAENTPTCLLVEQKGNITDTFITFVAETYKLYQDYYETFDIEDTIIVADHNNILDLDKSAFALATEEEIEEILSREHTKVVEAETEDYDRLDHEIDTCLEGMDAPTPMDCLRNYSGVFNVHLIEKETLLEIVADLEHINECYYNTYSEDVKSNEGEFPGSILGHQLAYEFLTKTVNDLHQHVANNNELKVTSSDKRRSRGLVMSPVAH